MQHKALETHQHCWQALCTETKGGKMHSISGLCLFLKVIIFLHLMLWLSFTLFVWDWILSSKFSFGAFFTCTAIAQIYLQLHGAEHFVASQRINTLLFFTRHSTDNKTKIRFVTAWYIPKIYLQVIFQKTKINLLLIWTKSFLMS